MKIRHVLWITAVAVLVVTPAWGQGTLFVEGNNVGIGTDTPTARLHVVETSGNADLNFDAAASANFLLDRGNQLSFSRFQFLTAGTLFWSMGMVNDSSNNFNLGPNASTTYLFVNRTNGRVGIGTKTPQGLLDVNGAIFQRGGLLHADYVFDPSYSLESIEEHSDFMWSNRHLPAIPKASVDSNGQEIVEIGAHRRGIVEELEKAHIYIDELNERLKTKETEVAELEQRLQRLEHRLERLSE